MAGGKLGRLAQRLSALFVDRQVFVRDGGRLRAFTFRRSYQIAFVSAAGAAMLWAAGASLVAGFQGATLAEQDSLLSQEQAKLERQRNALEEMSRRRDALSARLSTSDRELAEARTGLAELNATLAELRAELAAANQIIATSSNDGARLAAELRDLRGRIGKLTEANASLASDLKARDEELGRVRRSGAEARAEAARHLAALDETHARLADWRRQSMTMEHHLLAATWRISRSAVRQRTVSTERDALRLELDRLERRHARLAVFRALGDAAVQERLLAAETALREIAGERDEAVQSGTQLELKVGVLQEQLAELRATQLDLVQRLQSHTERTIKGLEALVRVTGLDMDRLLPRLLEGQPVGGPFVDIGLLADGPADGIYEARTTPFDGAVEQLESRLSRWSALTNLVEMLPIGSPVDHYYVSSKYGKRRDPFTKRWAVHRGVDLAGPSREDVFATAPGEIVFAGWNGPYGRMIEIDHGHGLTTVYAHLRRILVKKGDKVAFRQQIGEMGSTGRSSGVHVHYEIRIDGDSVDPQRFMTAGKYVFKQGQD